MGLKDKIGAIPLIVTGFALVWFIVELVELWIK